MLFSNLVVSWLCTLCSFLPLFHLRLFLKIRLIHFPAFPIFQESTHPTTEFYPYLSIEKSDQNYIPVALILSPVPGCGIRSRVHLIFVLWIKCVNNWIYNDILLSIIVDVLFGPCTWEGATADEELASCGFGWTGRLLLCS